MIRVVVTDQDLRARDHLTTVINAQSDMAVVATVGTANDVFLAVIEHQPDVVVLDSRLAADGQDLAAQLRAIRPETSLLVHDTGTRRRGVASPTSSGRALVVFKQIRSGQLLAAIRQLGGVELPGAPGPPV